MDAIRELILDSVGKILEDEVFNDWVRGQALSSTRFVLINNSFVFREELPTTKNSYFLAVPCDDRGQPDRVRLGIATGHRFNVDFKQVRTDNGGFSCEPLDEAVLRELRSIGQLIFVLIGVIDEGVRITEDVGHRMLGSLILDPRLPEPVRLEGRDVIIKDTLDVEWAWSEVARLGQAQGLFQEEPSEELRASFAQAFDRLAAANYAVVRLPGKTSVQEPTLLEAFASALDSHVQEYKKSLTALQTSGADTANLTNVMRIAYNFASEATKLLRILVSVCDLKPILSWCTIGQHFLLAKAFRELPWGGTKKKPSLKTYEETVKAARNRAFHNLLPINRSLEVDLEGVTVNARRLKLFSEYRKKDHNIFEYEDKELVDLLLQFTRAREMAVPMSFWNRNLTVMERTVDLLAAMGGALSVLWQCKNTLVGHNAQQLSASPV